MIEKRNKDNLPKKKYPIKEKEKRQNVANQVQKHRKTADNVNSGVKKMHVEMNHENAPKNKGTKL